MISNLVRSTLALGLALASLVTNPSSALSADLAPAASSTEDCWLEGRVACEEIPQAIIDDDPALLTRALDRWEESCGDQDLVWRTRLLGSIWSGTYADSLLGDDPAPRMVRYLEWFEGQRLPELSVEVRALPARSPLDTLEQCAGLEDFLIDMADQLLPHTEPGSTEELLVTFFAGDFETALGGLQGAEFSRTPLGESYRRLLERVDSHRGVVLEAALSAALWSPASGLDGVGSRPSLGAWAALRSDRVALRGVAELRVGGSKRDYEVRDGDELIETGAFTGIHLGVEPAIALLRDSRTEILIEGGLGWYGVEALAAEPDADLDAVWVHSLARSIGFSVTLFNALESGYFVNLGAHREWNAFATGSGAEDLVGSAWLVRVSFGKRTNPERERWRRALNAH